jgi:HK97 family phage major capsid protein
MKRTLKYPGRGVQFRPVLSLGRIAGEPEKRTEGEAEGDASYSIEMSSEYPVERMDWWTGQTYREVLLHGEENVDMSRAGSGAFPVLEEHRGTQIGNVDSASLADGKLVGSARFSDGQRGSEAESDVRRGIRKSTSVGYLPMQARLVEQNEELGDLWEIVRWLPLEVSLVGVPADPTVGVRSAEGQIYPPVEVIGANTEEEESDMNLGRTFNDRGAGGGDPAKGKETAGGGVVVTDPPKKEREEPKQIDSQWIWDTCVRFQCGELAGSFVEKGATRDEVMNAIIDKRTTKGKVGSKVEGLEDAGIDLKDVRDYSLGRALRISAGMANPSERGDRDEVRGMTEKREGVEWEVHEHLRKRLPDETDLHEGGILVPLSFKSREWMGPTHKRTGLDSKTVAKGAELVYEDQPGEIITPLRNLAAVLKLGGRVLAGLKGDIPFPRQSGSMTAYWVGENPPADVSDSDLALGLLIMAAKTLSASGSYSRQLLMQSSFGVDQLIADDIAAVHALAIDKAGIHGLGAAGEPTGVYKALNVAATAVGGAMTYAKLLAMQGQVATANAYMGALGWIMNPTMATNLRGTLDFPASAAGRPIWDGTYEDGKVAMYPAVATNQVSTTMTGSEPTGGAELGATFGNWSDVLFGAFGALELVVDPYRLKKRQMIEVTSFQMADVLIRRGESFSKATGATG